MRALSTTPSADPHPPVDNNSISTHHHHIMGFRRPVPTDIQHEPSPESQSLYGPEILNSARSLFDPQTGAISQRQQLKTWHATGPAELPYVAQRHASVAITRNETKQQSQQPRQYIVHQ